MAHVGYGTTFANRDDARNALITAIKDEIRGFLDASPGYFSAYCVIRLATILGQLIDYPENNSAECDGLQFKITEWKVDLN